MVSRSIRLPSGLRVRVSRANKDAARADDRVDGTRMFAGRALAALLAGDVVVASLDGKTREALDRAALLALDARDFHVLRDVCERLGAIEPEETDAGECRNCDAPIVVDALHASLDALEDRFVDEPVVRETELSFGMAVRVGRSRARTVTLRTPTVDQVRPLWIALGRDGALRVTPAVVRALGVRALGDETRASAIAEALSRAPDRAWAVVEQGFLEVAYAERAFHPLTCAACGALHEVDAPLTREFALDPALGDGAGPARRRDAATNGEGEERFPDARAFEERVARIGAEVYAARAVRNIALRVDDGVPEIDTAGEPLLGSYEPRQDVDAAGNVTTEFLVTVYYRSFRKMYEEDGPYDIDAELRDTIDHEIEHHLFYLSGHDPMDARERAEARRDLEDVYGKNTLRREERRALLRELGRGLRFVLPLLLGLVALLYLLDWLGYLA